MKTSTKGLRSPVSKGARLLGFKNVSSLMYSIGKIINNIVITLHGESRLLDLLWWSHCVRFINVGSLCYTPETNMKL